MGSRKFYINIVVRVLLLTISILLISLLRFNSSYLYSGGTLVIITILQTWLLISYIMRQRNDMSRMLSYIRESNPTLFFSEQRDTPFKELGDFLNDIGEIVRDVRIDKESQLHYMNHITDHVPVGLIAFDQFGTVEFFNPAARELTGLKSLATIDGLNRVLPGLDNLIRETRTDERRVITINRPDRILHLSLKTSRFSMGNREIRLISLQDIGKELDEKEIDAWQKLIRILTHEIINSVTPITSLSSVLAGIFRGNMAEMQGEPLSEEQVKKITTGLGYIEERGNGLIDFVNRYRSLTKIALPRPEQTDLTELVSNIFFMKEKEAAEAGISIIVNNDGGSFSAYCDRTLTGHVILNLLNNAIEAFEGVTDNREKIINVSFISHTTGSTSLTISDTGKGIDPAISEDIFIPFFTTRENGSGIGLSLSRQIMRMQGGSIVMVPATGTGATFIVRFPSGNTTPKPGVNI